MFERIFSNPHPQPLPDELVEQIHAYKEAVQPRAVFVRKIVNKKDWEDFYQYSSYCRLGETPDKKVIIGFIVANEIPVGCELMDESDLTIFQAWAKSCNYYPRPFAN